MKEEFTRYIIILLMAVVLISCITAIRRWAYGVKREVESQKCNCIDCNCLCQDR